MHVILWPKGLIGRVTAVILVAILLQFVGSLFVQDQVDRFTLREDHARRVAELLVVGERLLTEARPERRPEILKTLSTQHLTVELRAVPTVAGSERDTVMLDRMRDRIVGWEPSLAALPLRLAVDPEGGRRDLIGALQLRDGTWLEFRSRDLFGRWPQLYRTFGSVAILTCGVLIAAAMLVRTLGTPLRALALAADKVGHGSPVTVLERGPRDLSQVARAFNAMQTRIGRLIDDRTQALAAVGHDLRTPLTRMRLRLDLMQDPEAREAMASDIGEMEAMLDSVLAYLSGDDPAPPRKVDLAALVSTLVEASADLGRAVTYAGPDRLHATLHPVPMKRAVSNLIENGLKYGGEVRVRLAEEGDEAVIVVADDGPGIPEEELEHVLAPFVRLDQARSRDTGGLGLGLTIVANAVEREGGRLQLRNRVGGGLDAEVRLPLHRQAA